jgi:molybdopterin molybdotransferase
MRIFTGAKLPEGADAVVMQENVTVGAGRASFGERPGVGTAVRYRASDLRAGDTALRRGTRLGPADLALAATCDVGHIAVTRRPRVIVLSNGDELRAPGSQGPAGTLPESNGIAIATMARRAGALVTRGTTLPDDRALVAKALDEALASADLVITIGGVSVGDHDVVKGALADAGVTLDFWRVAIKPGKPLAVGSRGHAIVLGLPGNPASAMVTFGLFGVPLVRALAGTSEPRPRSRPAVLGHSVTHEPGRMELLRARLETSGGEIVARAVKHQASGAGIGMSVANALVVIPRESHGLDQGAVVETYPFEELCL